jgi:GDP-mannose 6-dehydrogenase
MPRMQVAIVGLGYVGAVTAACLASLGRNVIGVDSDPVKSEAIAAGQSPISEPGLDELLAEGAAAGRIRVADVADAVRDADVIMIAVGTPSAASGALDLGAVTRVAQQIGAALPSDGRFRTVVVRSTVLPGTTETEVQPHLEAHGLKAGVDFGLAMNPEFLRESSSIRDFFEASRTVIGASDNAFHALKISFANEIASFARAFNVDGRQAMELMMSDDRLNISTVYLRPGFSFGGSCLPKDLRALTDRARKTDLELPLLNAALASNAAHFERGVAMVEAAGGRRISLLGLTFKSATDDLRESPAVSLAERLIGRGYQLQIFDPDVSPDALRGANRAFMEAHLPHLGALLCGSLTDVLDGAETVVVTKRWPEVDDLASRLGPNQRVVDLVGVPQLDTALGERYAGIGW